MFFYNYFLSPQEPFIFLCDQLSLSNPELSYKLTQQFTDFKDGEHGDEVEGESPAQAGEEGVGGVSGLLLNPRDDGGFVVYVHGD